MANDDAAPDLTAALQPWLAWMDQHCRLVEASLEWQRSAWQPWLEWQWALASQAMEQMGQPWLLRGEEQLG